MILPLRRIRPGGSISGAPMIYAASDNQLPLQRPLVSKTPSWPRSGTDGSFRSLAHNVASMAPNRPAATPAIWSLSRLYRTSRAHHRKTVLDLSDITALTTLANVPSLSKIISKASFTMLRVPRSTGFVLAHEHSANVNSIFPSGTNTMCLDQTTP